MAAREFDIVIFGATGFTGQYVFEELARLSKSENVKFALAARSENKLKSVIEKSKEYLQSIGEPIDADIPIIIADISDENSLLEMCKKTKVLLNCVGPYNLFGERVVKACLAAETHHLDVSGEPQFLEGMQLKYHEEAIQKGIYIIGACGFDSIPCDLGVSLVKKKFQGDLNSVETYLEFNSGPQGETINTGTWNSIVYGITSMNKTKEIRKELNKTVFKKRPNFSHPLSKRPVVFKSDITNKWCIPFPGSDKAVTSRSQLFNYNYKNERPVQIQTYFVTSLFNLFFILLMGMMLFIFSRFKYGRKLLVSYPHLFSFGKFKEGGPSRQEIKESSVTTVFWAEGWKDKLDVDKQHTEQPNKNMKVILTAPDAAYITTSRCLVNAGVVCLKENEKMPGSGGVLTPAAAFEDTSLLERLQKSGMEFSIIEK
ncbi:saccharopine dehydrogenase-like oxidoreductase [Centruroides sculpturatus]|uniref:saccharopine dehydrogenase-like oxidoreductase n=1 Tax=Centruroides sculpturatus TaxID=218467 RepID=UPI000C6EF511|nr:saccharopine dehydrogenase-like oxidoreductase [Centruroides sculpturatus]